VALSLDEVTEARRARQAAAATGRGSVPPDAPLEMPVQSLASHSSPAPLADSRPAVRFARLVTFGGCGALTVFGGYQMFLVVSAGTVTPLEWLMLGLFVVTFSWIALAASTALAGLMPIGRPGGRAEPDALPVGRTALVMPVYNEDAAATAAAIQAMTEGLASRPGSDRFEVFILSDTRDPEIWLAETAVFHALRNAVPGGIAVWYRRRHDNEGRKSGNLQDFVSRWGARYDYMIVLDADSLLDPDSLLALVREMGADSGLGILQSVPVLADGHSLFARLQQFASRVYGPVVSRGLAAWQGEDGNYWGHNAIIRVAAFAGACGLPVLPGRHPFGGHIMSHDFVEAALIRRAGWKVRMLPRLGGSWEGGPPSLLDLAARDRRWAQGNIQHLAVLPAAGLAWPSRVHFLTGIMGYLVSPLWLGMISVGVALSLQAGLIRPEYFTQEFQLFPAWPRFDTERMIWLLAFTLAVLLLPKLLGIVRAIFDAGLRRGAGGALALLASALVELLLTALYASVQLAIQSHQVWDILLGRDSGWSAQRRGGSEATWREVSRRHCWHTLIGAAITCTLWLLSPVLLLWMAPLLLGLLLAIPLSKVSGSERAGRLLGRLGLLTVPEETARPAILTARDRAVPGFRAVAAATGLKRLASDAEARAIHFAAVLPAPPFVRGRPDLDRLAAAAKLDQAESLAEARQWLSRAEWMAVLGDPELFARLDRMAPLDPPRPVRAAE